MTTQTESASGSASRYACTTCRVLFRSAFHRCPLDAGDIVELAPGDDPLLGATLGGRYRIEELVGDGDVGRHYRASHVELPRHFTIVVPYGEIAAVGASRGRFRRGAQAASKLDHPGVVPVFDVGEGEERLLYVVMDDVVGRDLRSIISWDSPLAPERAMSLARQLARGLEHAHGLGVRHGDLRPENVIVVEKDGREIARISGFGLAPQPPDAQSDLYRLGVLFYEMLAGCPPFDDEDAFDGVGMAPPPIRQRAPQATPQPQLERVALRLLAGEQAARYRSAAAVVADLETVSAAPETAPAPAPIGLATAFDLAITDPDRPVLLPARPVPLPGRPAPRSASTDDEPLVTERRKRIAIFAFTVGILAAFASVAFALLRSNSQEAPVASAAPIADASPPVPPPTPVAATPPPAVVDAAPAAAPPETVDAAPPTTAPRRRVAVATPRARTASRARARYPEEEVADAPQPDPPPDAAPPSPPDAAPPPATDGEKTAASRQAADALVRDGAKLFLSGKTEEAKKKFQGALLLDSHSAAAHRGLGFAYQKLGDRAKAAEHLRRYLDLAPDARDADEIRTRLRSLEE